MVVWIMKTTIINNYRYVCRYHTLFYNYKLAHRITISFYTEYHESIACWRSCHRINNLNNMFSFGLIMWLLFHVCNNITGILFTI